MIPTVLYYHQVLRSPRPEHYSLQSALTLDVFRAAMTELREHWHPLSIDEFVWIWTNGRRWPPRAVLITFDDGYKNNLWAAEVLRELDLTATFFVVSGVVGTSFQPWYVRYAEALTSRRRDQWACSWGSVDFKNEISRRRWLKSTKDHLLALRPAQRDAALDEIRAAAESASRADVDPDQEFLSVDDLKRLQSLGMTIGGHSATHDDLAACNAQELRAEMIDSADQLSQWTAQPVRYFSYPDGRYHQGCVDLARQRFDAAFTIESRYSAPDLWRVPRRSGEDAGDVRTILSPWFPAKRKAVNAAKWLLRC